MTVVADSGPLIHLAIVGQFLLLKQYFRKLLIIPQVYDEVVTQGKGRPGDPELRQAVRDGWVAVEPMTDPASVQRLTAPNISETDAAVVAHALEKRATLVLGDDPDVRELAEREGLSVMGSVGILTQARLEGARAGRAGRPFSHGQCGHSHPSPSRGTEQLPRLKARGSRSPEGD
jgi:predicted nucleic acid-binding protein